MGEFYNRIQSGSLQYRSMAAALRVQNGPCWTTSILNRMGLQFSIFHQAKSTICSTSNKTFTCTTEAMKYVYDNEPTARDLHLEYLQKYHHNDATV